MGVIYTDKQLRERILAAVDEIASWGRGAPAFSSVANFEGLSGPRTPKLIEALIADGSLILRTERNGDRFFRRLYRAGDL